MVMVMMIRMIRMTMVMMMVALMVMMMVMVLVLVVVMMMVMLMIRMTMMMVVFSHDQPISLTSIRWRRPQKTGLTASRRNKNDYNRPNAFASSERNTAKARQVLRNELGRLG